MYLNWQKKKKSFLKVSFPLLWISSNLLLLSFSLSLKIRTIGLCHHFRTESYVLATKLDFLKKTLILFVDYSEWLLFLPLVPWQFPLPTVLCFRSFSVENRNGNKTEGMRFSLLTKWSSQCFLYGLASSAPFIFLSVDLWQLNLFISLLVLRHLQGHLKSSFFIRITTLKHLTIYHKWDSLA